MTRKKQRKVQDAKPTGLAGCKGQISSLKRQIKEKYLTLEEMLEIAAEREAANLLNDNDLKPTEQSQ